MVDNVSHFFLLTGDVGDCFYMISSGEVTVTVNHMQVAVLGAGAFFGEVSLLSNERRTATVAASTETTCLVSQLPCYY